MARKCQRRKRYSPTNAASNTAQQPASGYHASNDPGNANGARMPNAASQPPGCASSAIASDSTAIAPSRQAQNNVTPRVYAATPGKARRASPSTRRTKREIRGSHPRRNVRAKNHAKPPRNTIGNAIRASCTCPDNAGTSSNVASTTHASEAALLRRRQIDGNHASNNSNTAARLNACRCNNPPAKASAPQTSSTSASHGTRRGASVRRWVAASDIRRVGLEAAGECI